MIRKYSLWLPCLLLVGLTFPVRAEEKANGKFTLTDEAVLKILYGGAKAPKGFYTEKHEEAPNTSISILWVTRFDKQKRQHLPIHAKTLEEAQELTQTYLNGLNVPPEAKKILAGERKGQYFQFKSKHTIRDNTYWSHTRIWRSDFFQPSGLTRGGGPGANVKAEIGKLTAKVEPMSVQWLAEFLWWNNNHNHVGSHVLTAPMVKQTDDSVELVMYTATMVFGDFGVTDVAHVQEWKMSVDAKTGAVSRAVKEIKQIQGRKKPGNIIR